MCEPVNGDTPVQALHRAVDQLSSIDGGPAISGDVIDHNNECLRRADHILTLAQAVFDHYDSKRQEMIMKLQNVETTREAVRGAT